MAPNTITVHHRTHYTYTTPVEQAQHVACLRPLDDDVQQVERFDMAVEPAPAFHHTVRDTYGNSRAFFTTTQPHTRLAVTTTSRVRVRAREPVLEPARTPPWEAVAARLRYAKGAPFEPAVEFSLPSPYVPRLAALHALAAPCFAPGTPVAAGAIALMRRIHREFAYRAASTEIETPLAEVLEKKRGVCQDFAHVAIGALRLQGLAARYVSGYLLTEAPVDEPAPSGDAARSADAAVRPMIGADASHAWLAVWCPGLYGGAGGDWLELDPTNDLLPGDGHVRLAVGRDYGDVAPLRGVIRGGGEHVLEVAVRTEKVRKLLGALE